MVLVDFGFNNKINAEFRLFNTVFATDYCPVRRIIAIRCINYKAALFKLCKHQNIFVAFKLISKLLFAFAVHLVIFIDCSFAIWVWMEHSPFFFKILFCNRVKFKNVAWIGFIAVNHFIMRDFLSRNALEHFLDFICCFFKYILVVEQFSSWYIFQDFEYCKSWQHGLTHYVIYNFKIWLLFCIANLYFSSVLVCIVRKFELSSIVKFTVRFFN